MKTLAKAFLLLVVVVVVYLAIVQSKSWLESEQAPMVYPAYQNERIGSGHSCDLTIIDPQDGLYAGFYGQTRTVPGDTKIFGRYVHGPDGNVPAHVFWSECSD
jgi:hypothetical protein